MRTPPARSPQPSARWGFAARWELRLLSTAGSGGWSPWVPRDRSRCHRAPRSASATSPKCSLPPELHDQKRQLSDIGSVLSGASEDLREISRGIHPAILSKGGLRPALKTLARRSPVPVELDLTIDRRFAESVEVAAHYVVAEALTNAAKHAQASEVTLSARADDHNLNLSIRDNGVGGAHSRNGSGLIGLKDRVEALGGHIDVVSPPGNGTSLHVTLPLDPA